MREDTDRSCFIPHPSSLIRYKGSRDMTSAVYTKAPARAGTRLVDYVQLTRPRLSVMALLTVAAGAILASAGAPDWGIVAHAVVGAGLVAAGASALNQLMEREVYARMRRTQDPPVPPAKLPPTPVLLFCFGRATRLLSLL